MNVEPSEAYTVNTPEGGKMKLRETWTWAGVCGQHALSGNERTRVVDYRPLQHAGDGRERVTMIETIGGPGVARAALATLLIPPTHSRRGERTAQARVPVPGAGDTSPNTGSLRLTGRARASGPRRGRGRSPSARGAIERKRRTRILDAPGSGSLRAVSHHRAGGGGG